MTKRKGAEAIRVHRVSDFSSFQALHDQWNSLVLRHQRPSVFLRHEWFDAAWQWCQNQRQLLVLCIYSKDRLIGIGPFCIHRMKRLGLPYRQVSMIDVPDTQECDVISGHGDAQDVVCAMLDYMNESSCWDIANFLKISEDSALFNHISIACKERNICWTVRESGENLGVLLIGGWDKYYRTRSRRLKKGNNLMRNKIYAPENRVRILWTMDSNLTTEDTDDLLLATKTVSAKSWKRDTGLTLDHPGPGAFFDRLSSHARENDWLSIWGLEINREIVAIEYQLVYDGTVSALRADYDPATAKLSPGSYLNWRILESLFDTENHIYRMGPGANPYKLRWANQRAALHDITLYNRTWKGRIFWFLMGIIKPIVSKSIASCRAHLRRLRRNTSISGIKG